MRHGRAPHVLSLRRDDRSMWVGVADASPVIPTVPTHGPAADSTSGRGLLIVASFARTRRIHPHDDGRGKTVWFELRS